ncbi:Gfo/Idh/MocA family protein [Schaalia hyovaginalis]|uniref:Gfo/Idh/MocA family protein n=1 Tax=Schaalia hyovaginalis TaxID=29316 RepID=UPI0026F1C4E9|nr:Gfo/Idh/MocA family oxidoreductase [Schaalia hyovaginalis]MCI6557637.1 Gfo/Idh/MocA family oxidoreductase [Schaalia hyovaginalis]MDD7553292.1 Gfo/Idh/MocA family oxidoreductase [Schaalia hyovaginalis]MDY3094770.1 Gfo/Idh/MocA family oxidoreductase [Schaalia hyovaginalis]
MGDIRVGILGIGSMGRHHVRNARNTKGFDLVALADPAGDKFGVAGDLAVLPDVDALIAEGVDAAIVAVPTVFHEEAALKLAEAGVHALVEKPLSFSVESGERIAKAFSDAGLIGAVGYVERCNPALLEMRRRIRDGQLGEVYQIITRRQSPFPARIADVGVVKDLATHDVDLAAWVAGSTYETVYAQTAYRSGREHEDMMVASGRFANGVLVNHLVNWLSPYKDRTTIVTGERGALVADTAMGDLTFYENGSFPVEWDQIANFRGVSEGEVTRYALAKREPLAVEHEHFRDAILGVSNEHVSMGEGLTTLRVLEAILESAKTGESIRL